MSVPSSLIITQDAKQLIESTTSHGVVVPFSEIRDSAIAASSPTKNTFPSKKLTAHQYLVTVLQALVSAILAPVIQILSERAMSC